MLFRSATVGCDLDGAEAAVALMKARVEETPLAFAEGWRFALGSVGSDVTAEGVLHGFLPGGYPPM